MELTEQQGNLIAAEIIDTEQRFISDGLLDPPGINDAGFRAGLTTEHFADPSHASLYEYICRAAETGEQITIEKAVAHAGKNLLTAEDVRFIAKRLFEKAPSSATLDELAQKIVDNHRRVERWRELGRERDAILDRDPCDSMKKAPAPSWVTVADIGAAPAYRKGLPAISTGYQVLDDALGGGFRPQCLYTLSARTGSAKSTLAINLARLMALNDTSTLMCKLEESPTEITWRLHAAAAQVDFKRLMDCDASPHELQRLADGWQLIRDLPLRFSSNRNLEAIERTAREHKDAGGQVVIIDQLSHVDVPNSEIGYQTATITSNALRRLSVELDMPVVLVAQVNRAGSKSADPLSCNDLRDSGAVENDSAAVIFINKVREGEYVYGGAEPIRYLDLTIAKNRYGPCVSHEKPITLTWWPRCCRIEEPERKAVVPF